MESSLPKPVTRTSSRSTLETARGTHEFTIDGYSLHTGLGASKFISSNIFPVGGYNWSLVYYPDDDDDGGGRERYASVYLVLISKGVKVRALCSFRILDQKTGKWESRDNQNSPVVFDSNYWRSSGRTSYGAINFVKNSELEDPSSPYLRDDRLVIECDLTVIKEPMLDSEEGNDIIRKRDSSSELSKDMFNMFKSKVGADVDFDVAGEVISAHRAVLAARSPVFKAELYGLMRVKKEEQIAVHDMQPDVFKEFLHFIYTGFLSSDIIDLSRDEMIEMVKNLLEAADRYAVEKLKRLCENSLRKSLDVYNVVDMFALADQHNCDRLKDACAQFMASSNRLDEVGESKGYNALKRSCPTVLVDVLERTVAKYRKIM